MQKRKSLWAEFRGLIEELLKAGRTLEQLARGFETTAQTIVNRVSQADRDSGVRQDGPDHAALRRLRSENRQLKTERDILSHAAAWFARETYRRRVRIREGELGPLAHCQDGAAAAGLHQRLLRVAGV